MPITDPHLRRPSLFVPANRPGRLLDAYDAAGSGACLLAHAAAEA